MARHGGVSLRPRPVVLTGAIVVAVAVGGVTAAQAFGARGAGRGAGAAVARPSRDAAVVLAVLAVYYSRSLARDGYAGHSHGCVNVRDEAAAAWLFDHVPVGTPVVVYRTARD